VRLTNDFIQSNLGFDLANSDPETQFFHPAVTLGKIYDLVGMKYDKKQGHIESIVGQTTRTDFEQLLESDKCQSFKDFHAAVID
jgi:hypothetical protein